MENLLEAVIKLLVGFVSVLVGYFLIPWLKEKRIYSIVKKAVEAAEKLSETQDIDKKEYVKKVLASANVKLTDTVNAIIEGCVLELDLMISGLIGSDDDGEI